MNADFQFDVTDPEIALSARIELFCFAFRQLINHQLARNGPENISIFP